MSELRPLPASAVESLGLRFDGSPADKPNLGPWWFITDLVVYMKGGNPNLFWRLRRERAWDCASCLSVIRNAKPCGHHRQYGSECTCCGQEKPR